MSVQPPVARFFKDHFNFCLAIYDTKRGQHEGEESDKILAFHPSSEPLSVQCSIVGLSQAVVSLSATFSKAKDFHVMEAEKNLWVAYNCESSIWLLMVANTSWLTPVASITAIKAYLKSLYSLCVLTTGSVAKLLEQDLVTQKIRRKLQPFLYEVAVGLARSDSRDLAGLTNPLACRSALPFLPLPKNSILQVQSLVSRLLVMKVYSSWVVQGVLVCYDQYLLWSSLPRDDTVALWSLSTRSIMMAVRGTKGKARSKAKPPVLGSSEATSLPLLSPACWGAHPSGFILPTTAGQVQEGITTGRNIPSARQHFSEEAPMQVPCVWLKGGEDRVLLLPYYQDNLVVLLCLEDSLALTQDTLTALLGCLEPQGAALLKQLATETLGPNTWHVPGYRYNFQDHCAASVRATPPHKVGTLSTSSLSLLDDVSEEVRLERMALGEEQADEGERQPGGLGDVQVVCRSGQDCWVVVQHAGPKHLMVAMEQDQDKGVIGAVEHVQQLVDTLAPGSMVI